MLDHHYDGLEGDWAEYARVAQKFVGARRASLPPDDIEDLVQRIILAMHQVGQKIGKSPGGWLWTTARYELLHYWRERGSRRALSLNKEQEGDGNGKGRELWETIPIPQPDLDAQLDARMWLEGCSEKVMSIARKLVAGLPLTEAERGYLAWWRKLVGIPRPRSGRRLRSSHAYEVRLPPLRTTVYQAICLVLERSPTPLHEKEITRLVAEAYPPLAQRIKNFHRQVHAALCKRRKNGKCQRVAPATWRWNGASSAVVTEETRVPDLAEAVGASR